MVQHQPIPKRLFDQFPMRAFVEEVMDQGFNQETFCVGHYLPLVCSVDLFESRAMDPRKKVPTARISFPAKAMLSLEWSSMTAPAAAMTPPTVVFQLTAAARIVHLADFRSFTLEM